MQNTEMNRRKSVIEMACPPAELLSQASPVLRELLTMASATDERPIVEGSGLVASVRAGVLCPLKANHSLVVLFSFSVSPGSYRVWEEIMSHIAQPSSFARAQSCYKPELLIEMMTVAQR